MLPTAPVLPYNALTSMHVRYPIDVARARMAVAPKGVAQNLVAVFAEMSRDPRRWGAFYAGLTPTLAGIIPYSGTTWMTYETLKEALLRARGAEATAELPPQHNALCGGVAGIIGQTVSYPLDVVRRRMQTATLASGARTAPSMLAVFADLIKSEGMHGMYKGLSMNYFKAPIAMGISFSMYARVKQLLLEHERREAEAKAKAALEAAVAEELQKRAAGRRRAVNTRGCTRH